MGDHSTVAARREQMLDHIGRYRITLRATLERLFGIDPSSDVLALRRAGLIERNHGLPGRLGCYRLTPRGAAGRVPRDRGIENFVGRALLSHLSVLWFSCMSEHPRVRLEQDELEALLHGDAPHVDQAPHCADQRHADERRPEDPLLYRVFIVGQRAREDHALGAVQKTLDEARARQGALAQWIDNGLYGFAILTELAHRAPDLADAVRRRGLAQRARVLIETAPGPETLRGTLDAYRTSRP